MSRLAAVLLTAFVVTNVGNADAQEHHKAWWKYLKGTWTYEIAPLNAKGTVTWRIAAKGNAMVGRFVDADGLTSIEIGGWRADTKSMVAHGYGSKGNYWQLEFTTITADVIEGPNHGVLPDGRAYKGTFTGKKIDNDHYEWHFKGKTGEGEDLTMSGKYTRKNE